MAAALDFFEHAFDDPDRALELVHARRAEQSLKSFTHLVWSIIEPGRALVYGWHMEAISEHLEAVTNGEIRRLVINVPPGFSKAAHIDTPVLTTWGWKRHGDLEAGDYVFGPDGRPRLVEGVTPRYREESYRVTFDCGASEIISAGHLWSVGRDHFDRKGKRCRVPVVVRTTDLQAGTRGDCIDVAEPVRLPPKRLLIDPYILGAWLGDGGKGGGALYVGHQDIEHFRVLGNTTQTHEASDRGQAFYRVTVPGLSKRLRVLELLYDKHVPDDYLEASIEQRWALLQGLMDTDGHCSTTGLPTFTNTNVAIARGAYRVACSLGLKARIAKRASWLDGVRYQDAYRVTFTPRPGDVVFRLERKQARVKTTGNVRQRRRYVRSVEPVGPQEVSCIHVEGKLYLLGHAMLVTHNSLLTNVIWPAWEWGPRDMPYLRYLSFAYAQSLTIRDNVRCRRLLLSPLYQRLWGSRFSLVSEQNSKIRYDTDQAGFRMASSVGGTGTGERGDRVVMDDPDNVRSATSEKITTATLDWLSKVVPSRLTDIRTSAIVLIQQRTSVNDCTGHVLKHELGYEWLRLPMEFERKFPCYTPVRRAGVKPKRVRLVMLEEETVPKWLPAKQKAESLVRTEGPVRTLTSQDRRTKEGELLDPERFPKKHVEQDLKKPLQAIDGHRAVAGQLQQRPQERGGTMFLRKNFRFCNLTEVPKHVLSLLSRGYDLAATESTSASWTVGVKLGIDRKTSTIYLVDVARIRLEPGPLLEWHVALCEQDPGTVFHDYPQDPAAGGKSTKVFMGGRLAKFMIGFSIEGPQAKPERAIPFAAQVELGNVVLVRGAWTDVFIAEAVTFPGGDYNDQIDAAVRAHRRALIRPRGTQVPVGAKVIRG